MPIKGGNAQFCAARLANRGLEVSSMEVNLEWENTKSYIIIFENYG